MARVIPMGMTMNELCTKQKKEIDSLNRKIKKLSKQLDEANGLVVLGFSIIKEMEDERDCTTILPK